MDIHSAQTGPLEVNTFILPLAGRAVLLVDPAGCDYSGDEKPSPKFLTSMIALLWAFCLRTGTLTTFAA